MANNNTPEVEVELELDIDIDMETDNKESITKIVTMANNNTPEGESEIDDTCRLCKTNMRVNGILTNTRTLFKCFKNTYTEKAPNPRALFKSITPQHPRTPAGKVKTLSERFKDIGVVLLSRPGVFSGRICKPCFNILVRVEESLSIINKWKSQCAVELETHDGGTGREEKPFRHPPIQSGAGTSPHPDTSPDLDGSVATQTIRSCLNGNMSEWRAAPAEKRGLETPTETPPQKKLCRSFNPDSRVSSTEVYIYYPSKPYPEKFICDPDISGVINNLAKRKFPTAANLMVQHAGLMDALKPVMAGVIDRECQDLCHQRNGFILWKTSPKELKNFSLDSLKEDLEQKAPFMFSVICTISGMQTNHACAAAAIALRGRERHLSAFAYYVSSILQRSNKKTTFDRLSKFGITTAHSNVLAKKKAMSAVCGENLTKLKARRERPPTAQESAEEPVTVTEADYQCADLGSMDAQESIEEPVTVTEADYQCADLGSMDAQESIEEPVTVPEADYQCADLGSMDLPPLEFRLASSPQE